MERSGLERLTAQERACLRLVPLRNTDQIARETGLSPETVKSYLRRAREKLGVSRTVDAARMLLTSETRPPKEGHPSRGADIQAVLQAAPIHRAPEIPDPIASLHEERTTFSPAASRPAPLSEQRAADDRHWLTTLLQIVGLVIAIAVIILLAEPLSQSAQKLANLLSPP